MLTLFEKQKGGQDMSDYKIPASDRWKNQYSYAYKMEVIESIENGKLSQNQASKVYGVHRKTISTWLQKYGNFEKKLKEMGGKSPRQELADLRAKLRVSQGENQVLKAVMGIIEDEYGEEMLKKYLPESLLKTLPSQKQK
jgi:transposase